MKFIADVMLGRLAKHLRLLGIDILYDRTLGDNEIIRLSLEQDRVILTRDTGLAKRPLATRHLFITSDRIREQLDQVLASFDPKSAIHPLTRCAVCNEPLTSIKKKDVMNRVPDYVHEKYSSFLECPKCGRIYWQGTHIRKMKLQSEKS